jgi:hypothetical protein
MCVPARRDYGPAMTDWTEETKPGRKQKDGGVPPNNANQNCNGPEKWHIVAHQ